MNTTEVCYPPPPDGEKLPNGVRDVSDKSENKKREKKRIKRHLHDYTTTGLYLLAGHF